MSRKFAFHKDRMSMLAGLVEDDDFETIRHNLAEEYRRELHDDMDEVDTTLNEYTAYTGYVPSDEDEDDEVDTEEVDAAKPNPEEAGLPGWSYYDADPTMAKLMTMKDDLQHKKELQWVPPMAEELENDDLDEAFRLKVNQMIEGHVAINEMGGEDDTSWGDDTVQVGNGYYWEKQVSDNTPGTLQMGDIWILRDGSGVPQLTATVEDGIVVDATQQGNRRRPMNHDQHVASLERHLAGGHRGNPGMKVQHDLPGEMY
jgi:hypothetical protein